MTKTKISNDFDFIIGKWKVFNKRLKERLNNCREWIEFEADYASWHVLGGIGNMDEIKVKNDEMVFHGLSMRIFNPKKNEWTIYWADDHHPENGIKPQVAGTFENGVGTFYGEELFNNKPVKLRFIWKSINENHAYWEQAYFDETKKEWEVNWIMDFKK